MKLNALNPQQNPELQEALDRVSRAAMDLEALFEVRTEGIRTSPEDSRNLQEALKATKEIREMLQG